MGRGWLFQIVSAPWKMWVELRKLEVLLRELGGAYPERVDSFNSKTI